jgi:hypothetical protein
MWKRLIVIDLVLAAVLAAGLWKLRQNWLDFESAHRVSAVKPEADTPRTLAAPAPAAVSTGDWTDIVTKNVFSFDRNDIDIVPPKPVETAAPVAAQLAPALLAQKPILYGTVGIGNSWMASLASGTASNLAPHVMKVGETIDGWQLMEIRTNAVVMTLGNMRETILMNNLPPIQRSTARTDTPLESTVVAPTPPPSTPAPAAAASPADRPPPPGRGAKGHWVQSPFGPTWVEDN